MMRRARAWLLLWNGTATAAAWAAGRRQGAGCHLPPLSWPVRPRVDRHRCCCPTPSPAQLHNYHGPAVAPRHLSLWEKWRGYGARPTGMAATHFPTGCRGRYHVRAPPPSHRLPLPAAGAHYDAKLDAQQCKLQQEMVVEVPHEPALAKEAL